MTPDTEHAKGQARAQLAQINRMMERLQHAQECGWTEEGDQCDLTGQEIIDCIDELDRELYHDPEDARQRIQEDSLSVLVRSGWHSPGEEMEAVEYEILLSTGGPATRIVGDLDQHDEPSSATLQYQDWGTPWTHYAGSYNQPALLDYANQFYFAS